jgi:hypothetical protein
MTRVTVRRRSGTGTMPKLPDLKHPDPMQLEATQERLGKSYDLGDAKQIKLMALDDDDLKPLWEGEAK